MITTLGQALVNEALPDKHKDYARQISGKNLDGILTDIAANDPDKYKSVSHKLLELGGEHAFLEGTSLSLDDLRSDVDKQSYFDILDAKEAELDALPGISNKEREKARGELYTEVHDALIDETYKSSLAKKNPLAMQVEAKARGNPIQLAAIQTASGRFTDHKNNIIPIFIKRSYTEGIKPHEKYAASFGARAGVISTKFATRDAGDLGKQFVTAASDKMITVADCGSTEGTPFDINDDQSIGAYLSKDTGGFKSGQAITGKMLNTLRKGKFKKIVTRSPLTCSAEQGLCAKCAGLQEDQHLAKVGEHIGMKAASALQERVAQSGLNVKHCLSFDTEVLMYDNTVKQIKDINRGDYVHGVTEDGKLTKTKVVAVFDNGIRDIYSTQFKHGNKETIQADLHSTLDHKLWSMRRVSGQLDAKYNGIPRMLPVGQLSQVFFAVGHMGLDDSDTSLYKEEPLGLLLGLLLGGGCYTESVNSIHFSTEDEQLKKEVVAYMATLNLQIVKCKGHKFYHRISVIDDDLTDKRDCKTGRVIAGARNPAKVYLIKHGMYGKYAYEKEIPPIVDTWNNKSVGALIAGLIITDGSVYRSKTGSTGIAFGSTSKLMVERLKYLLLYRFGIEATNITKTRKKGMEHYYEKQDITFKYNHDMWQTTITTRYGVKRFQKLIPLYGVKRIKLDTYIREQHTQDSNVAYNRYRRISQEFVGKLPTFDLQVELDSHRFLLANGLVVSNSGGQSSGSKEFTGYKYLNQLVQSPSTFPDEAPLATLDGTVNKIDEAPQGGHYVYVGDEQHYVPQDLALQVKVGETLEAGDQIADGLVNPKQVVQYKGLGEGRRYLTERLTKMFNDSGVTTHRRNVEVVVRAMLDKVKIGNEGGLGGYLPGDIASYTNMATLYRPRKDSKYGPVRETKGRYLEQPVLHYTIGTRMTDKVMKELAEHKITSIVTHEDQPGFTPEVERLRTGGTKAQGDWMARLRGSYLKENLQEATRTGAISDRRGTNPTAALAYGLDFASGKNNNKVTY